MEEQQNNLRVDNTTAVFMVIVAVFFDLLSIVPGANYISLIFANGILGIWLFTKGVGLISARKLATEGLVLLIEAVPALSAFPTITIGVIVILVITRTEDKTGINPLDAKKGLNKKPNARIGDASKAKHSKSTHDNTPKKTRASTENLRKAA